jgi:hypothetical protein
MNVADDVIKFMCKYLKLVMQNPRKNRNKQTPWPESASELYRPSDRRFFPHSTVVDVTVLVHSH